MTSFKVGLLSTLNTLPSFYTYLFINCLNFFPLHVTAFFFLFLITFNTSASSVPVGYSSWLMHLLRLTGCFCDRVSRLLWCRMPFSCRPTGERGGSATLPAN